MTNKTDQSIFVKQTAAELGFEYCGIAKAEYLNEDARRLERWLQNGMHGEMSYMQNNFDLRVNPSKLVPGAKSVITLLMNYAPKQIQENKKEKIARYAYGEDYHEHIRKKLNSFFEIIRKKIGEINGRGFVDSAPVLERSWAQKAGLGWIGKNGNLITKQTGSYFFIASLIVDIALEYDDAFAKDYCGTCTKCIDACPTDAILPEKVIDGSKCISYFTIELKDAMLPQGMRSKFDDWLFGCDVCQEVCPWNKFQKASTEKAFEPMSAVLNFTTKDWEELTEENFKTIFAKSPIKRAKFKGIKRNLKFLQKAD